LNAQIAFFNVPYETLKILGMKILYSLKENATYNKRSRGVINNIYIGNKKNTYYWLLRQSRNNGIAQSAIPRGSKLAFLKIFSNIIIHTRSNYKYI
jgi:hypothetical protein